MFSCMHFIKTLRSPDASSRKCLRPLIMQGEVNINYHLSTEIKLLPQDTTPNTFEKETNDSYHNSFQNFICDWRQDTFIIVNTKVGVDLGQHGNLGSEQDPEGNVDILQICNMYQHHDYHWAINISNYRISSVFSGMSLSTCTLQLVFSGNQECLSWSDPVSLTVITGSRSAKCYFFSL